jgi:CRP-like cAMP-binding protein
VRFAKNTAVFQQGAEAHSFFVLPHRHLRASKTTPAGEQIVVRYVAPGETFGVAKAIGLQRQPERRPWSCHSPSRDASAGSNGQSWF